MDAFWLSFGMIFLAELGDKSQLLALTLATRYKASVTLLGIFVATLTVHLASVALGGAAGEFLPTSWIQYLAGLAFIGFGFWTLRGDSIDDDGEGGGKRRFASPFLMVAVTFFCGELGDKTMLSTVTLAATHSVIPVWFGSTIGMVASDALAIVVGKILGARMPERAIKIGASVIFFGFGLFSMFDGGEHLSTLAWIVGVALVAIMLRLFVSDARKNALSLQSPQV